MALYVEVIGYRLSSDGQIIAGVRLERDGCKKILMYRIGVLIEVDKNKRENSRYIHEVADISFPNQIPSWRKIDSEKDFGFSPEIFREAMKELAVD